MKSTPPTSLLALSFPLVACLLNAACSQTTARPPTGVDASGAAGSVSGAAGTSSTGAAGTGTAGTGAAGTGAAGTGTTAGAAGDGQGGGTSGGGGSASGAAGAGGSGGHDAGATDAPPATDGATAGGCSAALCESFAGVEPGKTGSPWTLDVDTKGTVLETVADKGRKDTHSLHVKISGMAGVHGYITETQTLATTGASFWGRVFIWYAEDTANVHIVNVAVDGKMANGMSEQVRIVNVIGTHIATNRRSDDMGKGSSLMPPAGKWGCYEWHITPNTLDVYLDGTMLPISESWVEPTISLVRLGFERFAAGVAGDVWLDDVALGSDRIGCD